jgi:hypothetical protein
LLGEILIHLKVQLERILAQKRVQTIGRARREEVGGVAAHLVKIDGKTGQPVERCRDRGLRLRLGGRQPLTVQVEIIMVCAPPRPFIKMFAVLGVCNRHLGMIHIRPLPEAVGPVRVHSHNQMDHRLIKQRLMLGALTGCEMIEQEHRRVVA